MKLNKFIGVINRIMSDDKDFYNLCVKILRTLLKELNTELVYKFGRTYDNMTNGVREATKLWADTQRKEREKLVK